MQQIRRVVIKVLEKILWCQDLSITTKNQNGASDYFPCDTQKQKLDSKEAGIDTFERWC